MILLTNKSPDWPPFNYHKTVKMLPQSSWYSPSNEILGSESFTRWFVWGTSASAPGARDRTSASSQDVRGPESAFDHHIR